jgi:hypothetical protein
MIIGANTLLRKQGLRALETVGGLSRPFPCQSSSFRRGSAPSCLVDNDGDTLQTKTRQDYSRLKTQIDEYLTLARESVAKPDDRVQTLPAQPHRLVGPGIVIEGRPERYVVNLSQDGQRRVLTLDQTGRLQVDLGPTQLDFAENKDGVFISLHQSLESLFFHREPSGYVTVSRKSRADIA